MITNKEPLGAAFEGDTYVLNGMVYMFIDNQWVLVGTPLYETDNDEVDSDVLSKIDIDKVDKDIVNWMADEAQSEKKITKRIDPEQIQKGEALTRAINIVDSLFTTQVARYMPKHD